MAPGASKYQTCGSENIQDLSKSGDADTLYEIFGCREGSQINLETALFVLGGHSLLKKKPSKMKTWWQNKPPLFFCRRLSLSSVRGQSLFELDDACRGGALSREA